jgi:hypothetical protein
MAGRPGDQLAETGHRDRARRHLTVTQTGYPTDPSTKAVEFTENLEQNGVGEVGPVDVTAKEKPVTANYKGKVVTDTDINGAPARTAGLAGVVVTASSARFDGSTFDTTTDANGRFAFQGIPGGQYFLSFAAPNGWLVATRPDGNEVNVGATVKDTDRQFLASRPESQFLKVALAFDQPTYQIGATATLTVTLTNTSSTTLTGIHNRCDLSGEPGQFIGQGPGWSPFTDAAGATVPPGTSTFPVSETVRAQSSQAQITADCFFGTDVSTDTGDPRATATADVVSGS